MWKRDILNVNSYGSMEIFIIFRIFQLMNESQWAIVISIIHSVECSQHSFWLFNFKLFIIKMCVKKKELYRNHVANNKRSNSIEKKRRNWREREREKKSKKKKYYMVMIRPKHKSPNGSIRHKFMWLKENRLRSGFCCCCFIHAPICHWVQIITYDFIWTAIEIPFLILIRICIL